jgi:hypothetical protein
VALKEGAAGEQRGQADGRLPQLVPGELPAQIAEDVAAHRAVGDQCLGEAGEQLVEDLAAARVQAMQVPAVRHASPVVADLRQRIPLDDHHPLEPLRQHPRRQQARDAAAQDENLITVAAGHWLTPFPCASRRR